ncbi:MAG: DNA polymerase III subunit delta' [Pseudomonadota bacterium]
METTTLLPWFKESFTQLADNHKQDRLGHAWLFSGHPGIGKKALAQHFAKYLLCVNPGATGPCGTCDDCHLFSIGNHPDYSLVEPEKKLITVDQIRENISFAQNTSRRGGMKILLFVPAEAMNLNAANALLKLLEEPPKQTLLLLVSHQPGLLLATIKSRCLHLRCPLPPPAMAKVWLEQQGFTGQPEVALQLTGGAPLRALSLSDPGTVMARMTLLESLQAILDKTVTPIAAAKKCEKIGIAVCIEYLMLGVNDLLASWQSGKNLSDPTLKALADQLELHGAAEILSLRLHETYNILIEYRKVALASNNANAQLMLESLFVHWSSLTARL